MIYTAEWCFISCRIFTVCAVSQWPVPVEVSLDDSDATSESILARHFWLMEDMKKPRAKKHREVKSDWNHGAGCAVASVPVWNFENFKHLIFVVRNVRRVLWASWNLFATRRLKILSFIFSS
jgi:hypothetical protein